MHSCCTSNHPTFSRRDRNLNGPTDISSCSCPSAMECWISSPSVHRYSLDFSMLRWTHISVHLHFLPLSNLLPTYTLLNTRNALPTLLLLSGGFRVDQSSGCFASNLEPADELSLYSQATACADAGAGDASRWRQGVSDLTLDLRRCRARSCFLGVYIMAIASLDRI